MMDRAGLVGADGCTMPALSILPISAACPILMIMAAADELELMNMVATSAAYDQGPSALRYPRGEGVGLKLPERGTVLEIGKGRIMREGTTIAILNSATRLAECLKRRMSWRLMGCSPPWPNMRFAKPLDKAMIRQIAAEHEVVLTVEEGSIGGFGARCHAPVGE